MFTLENSKVVAACRELGCKAKTAHGIVNYYRANKFAVRATMRRLLSDRKAKQLEGKRWRPVVGANWPSHCWGWVKVAFDDPALADIAASNARSVFPRRQNWESPEPTVAPVPTGKVDERDNGRYSSRCTYTHYTYCPRYHSVVAYRRALRAVVYGSEGKVCRIIPAPRGLKWGADANGVYLRRTDGTEYHPTADDFRAKDFVKRVRSALTQSATARKEAARSAKLAESFRKAQDSCLVRLQDSVRAGNCLHGASAFCARNGLIDKIAKPYAYVRADVLRRIAGADASRVEAAINAAWERETLVTI